MTVRRILAGVVAVVLVAAACSSDDGVEEPDSRGGYQLTSVPDGYELCGVSTPSGLSLVPETIASLHVYGEGDVPDPYQDRLIGVALFPGLPVVELDLGETTPVRIGSTEGRLGTMEAFAGAALPAEAGRMVTWQHDDERFIQVGVRGDDDLDLVALAEGVVVTGDVARIAPDALPPGMVDLGDIYQLETRAQFLFSVDYQLRPEDSTVRDQMTLLGSLGDRSAMEAFRFRAASSRRIEVNGMPGVVADIGTTGRARTWSLGWSATTWCCACSRWRCPRRR